MSSPSTSFKPPQNIKDLIASSIFFKLGGCIAVPKTSPGSSKNLSYWL